LSFRSEAEESAFVAAINADLSAALRDDKAALRDDKAALRVTKLRCEMTKTLALAWLSRALEILLYALQRPA
jgi:hypothetical protein